MASQPQAFVVRRPAHPARARQEDRIPPRGQARRPGGGPARRGAHPQPRPRPGPRRRRGARRGLPARRPGRRHRQDRGARGRLPRDRGGRAAQPLLRLRPGGGQPGRRAGPLRLRGPDPRRRRRVDVAGADGLRRRRLGDGPGHRAHHLVRAAGHRRRPDRHAGGLDPAGRRRLRRRVAGAGRQGAGQRLLRPLGRAGPRPQRPHRARPGRVHPPRHHRGEPGRAAAVVRRDRRPGRLRLGGAGEVPLGRADRPRPPRRQLLGHRRRRRAGGDRHRAGRHATSG